MRKNAKVEASGKVPHLVKVAKTVFILPHGNAEVERIFSEVKDIVTYKRQSLSETSIQALTVSKSVLRTKNSNSASIPIGNDDKLMEFYNSSHAAYVSWKKQQELEARNKACEELQSRLLSDLEKKKWHRKLSSTQMLLNI